MYKNLIKMMEKSGLETISLKFLCPLDLLICTLNYKFSNKKDQVCAWRDLKKNLCCVHAYDKWIHKFHSYSILGMYTWSGFLIYSVFEILTGPFISQFPPYLPNRLHWNISYISGMILKDWQNMNKDDITIKIIPRLCSSICFLVKVLLGLWTRLLIMSRPRRLPDTIFV